MVTENTEPEEDYRARWEEATAQIEKLQNDLKAQATGQMRQRERDDLLRQIVERQEEIDTKFQYFGEALFNGNTEEAQAKMQRASEELSQQRSQNDWQRYMEDAGQRLLEETERLKNDDGQPLVDVRTSTDFTDLRTQWVDAQQRGDRVAIERLIGDARRMMHDKERETWTPPKEEAPRVDMSTAPPRSAGGYSSYHDLLRAYLANQIPKQRFEELRPQYGR